MSEQSQAENAPKPLARKILIAEDDAAIQKVIAARMASAGYSVVCVDEGSAVMDALAKESPDLILLDLMLPGVDGWSLCMRIKKNPATAKLPIIVLSGLVEEEGKAQSFEQCDFLMKKPFDGAKLLAEVRKLLER